MEAALKQTEKRSRDAGGPVKFGDPTGPDPAAAGRAGGRASGVARRLRPLTMLEQRVLDSRNGAAAVKLLEIKRRDEAELLAERASRDDELIQLGDWISEERELLDRLRDERRQVDHELAELREQAGMLRLRSATDEDLVELLRDVGEQRVERACIACGWIEAES